MSRLALATCRSLPDWEVDDHHLHRALSHRGISFDVVAWDAPVDWSAYALCLIRTTWDYHRRLEEFLDWVARVSAQTVLHNPLDLVRWNADKRYLRDLAQRGVPLLPTAWIESARDLESPEWIRVLEESPSGRGFIKPTVGATASDTLRFTINGAGIDQARRALSALLARGFAAMVQPYEASVETAGERSAIVLDGVLTHTVVKRPVRGDYRVQDDWGGTDTACDCTDRESTFVTTTLLALESLRADWARSAGHAQGTARGGMSSPLVARVDWLRNGQDEPVLNELEVIEPSLFLRHSPRAATVLADALARRLAEVG